MGGKYGDLPLCINEAFKNKCRFLCGNWDKNKKTDEEMFLN